MGSVPPESQASVRISLKILSDAVGKPSYARPGDAACDLQSAVSIDIPPLSRALVPTGISLEIPDGFAGLVVPRSGLAAQSGITCLNAPGIIDSGYRGEIKVILYNSDTTDSFVVNEGDRIAQLLVVAVPQMSFTLVEELSETVRGTGGFGHTGVGGSS